MGEKFGKFELVRKIAVGGMAEIFLATHMGPEGFKKHVAIKRILPHLTEDSDFVTMFLDEARLVARFNHPNLVQIFELGQVKTNYFLAMEYVQGSSMSKVIKACRKKEIPFPLEYGAKILSYACEGLEYAHNFTDPDGSLLNLIHRDVSPQNLMLSYDGVVKVLDFGIAKAAGNLYQTRTTSLKGKAAYMSPEQITQKTGMDRRSDIFSLGIVLYEFATGHRPFDGDTELELMMAIVQSPPRDPRGYNPNIPQGLLKIMTTALQKDRRQRYQSARELRADLEQFLLTQQMMVDSYTLSNFIREVLPPGEPLVGYSVPTPSRPSISDAAEAPVQQTPTSQKKKRPRQAGKKSEPSTGSRPLPAETAGVDDAPTMLTPSEVIRPLVNQAKAGEVTIERPLAPTEKRKSVPGEKKRAAPGKKPAAAEKPVPEEKPDAAAGMMASDRKKIMVIGVLLVLVVVAGAAAAFLAFGGDGTEDDGQTDAGAIVGPVAGGEEPQEAEPDAGAVATVTEPAAAPDAGAPVAADEGPAEAVKVAAADTGASRMEHGGKDKPGRRQKKKRRKRRLRRRVTNTKPHKKPDEKEGDEKKPEEKPKEKADAGTKVAVVDQNKEGSLVIYSQPWTNVNIDGVGYGSTPIEGDIKLKPGPHIVQLSNRSAGIRHRERVRILPGKKQTLRRKFRKGFLKIFVKPFGTVYINGAKKGQTPLGDLSLYEGTHNLRVTCKRTGKEDNRKIKIEPGKTSVLKLDLR